MKYAIASIQRDRGPWIVEWLAFHMMVGFNQFHIYAHRCVDDMPATLLKLSRAYPITVHEVTTDDRPQLASYQHAWNTHGDAVDWMAFIDGDEFLFPVRHAHIGEALAEYDDRTLSALCAYWMCYGSSGHVDEPAGLMLQNYPRHSRPDFISNRHVKSIVRGRQAVATTASHVFQTPHGSFDELMRPVHHGFMRELTPSHQTLRINHYMVQSWQFYLGTKQRIGAPDANPNLVRPPEWYRMNDRNDCDDGTAWNFLVPLKLKVRELQAVLAS